MMCVAWYPWGYQIPLDGVSKTRMKYLFMIVFPFHDSISPVSGASTKVPISNSTSLLLDIIQFLSKGDDFLYIMVYSEFFKPSRD